MEFPSPGACERGRVNRSHLVHPVPAAAGPMPPTLPCRAQQVSDAGQVHPEDRGKVSFQPEQKPTRLQQSPTAPPQKCVHPQLPPAPGSATSPGSRSGSSALGEAARPRAGSEQGGGGRDPRACDPHPLRAPLPPSCVSGKPRPLGAPGLHRSNADAGTLP